MEPYAPIGGADPFAASMKLVTALVAKLQAPGAAVLTAYELEQFVADRGREGQRQIVRAHLDRRAGRGRGTARAHERAGAGWGARARRSARRSGRRRRGTQGG